MRSHNRARAVLEVQLFERYVCGSGEAASNNIWLPLGKLKAAIWLKMYSLS
jgi:hypothetical protein